MKLYLVLVMVLISSVGCSTHRVEESQEERASRVSVPMTIVIRPIKITKLNVKIFSVSKARVARLSRLALVAAKIMNSAEFKRRVDASYYRGKPGFASSVLAPAVVSRLILEGNELRSGIDYEWDMEIEVKLGGRGVLGWTYPSIKKFYLNSRYLDARSDSGIVGTICHENSHKLGFGHDFKATARRPYSIPYVLGTICAQLYSTFK